MHLCIRGVKFWYCLPTEIAGAKLNSLAGKLMCEMGMNV